MHWLTGENRPKEFQCVRSRLANLFGQKLSDEVARNWPNRQNVPSSTMSILLAISACKFRHPENGQMAWMRNCAVSSTIRLARWLLASFDRGHLDQRDLKTSPKPLRGLQMKITHFKCSGLNAFLDYEFDLYPDVSFLHGINGSGKTTILRAIASLLTPDPVWLLNSIYDQLHLSLNHKGQKFLLIHVSKSAPGVATISISGAIDIHDTIHKCQYLLH